MTYNQKPGLTVAYFILAFSILCGITVFMCSTVLKPKEITIYKAESPPLLISNKNSPKQVESAFSGKPLLKFPQSDLGLPTDGTCFDYSNKVSWRIILCLGTQPEAQP